MYCDYKALDDYTATLNRNFNSVVKSFNGIEDNLKSAVNTNNWNSETRDYYAKLCDSIYNNFDAVNNKFMNIKQYLENVVNNYQQFDNL